MRFFDNNERLVFGAALLVLAAGVAVAGIGEHGEHTSQPKRSVAPDTAGLADYLETLGYELDTIFAADEGRFSVGALRPETVPEPVVLRVFDRTGKNRKLERRGTEYYVDEEKKAKSKVLRLLSDSSREKILRNQDGFFTVRDRLLLEREGETFREIGPRLTVEAIDPRNPMWVEAGGEGRFEGYFEQSYSADLGELLARALAFGPDGTLRVVFRDYVSVCRPATLEDLDADGRLELVEYENFSSRDCGAQVAVSERLDLLIYLPVVHQWNGDAWVPAQTRHPEFYRSVSERLREAWKWAEDNCAVENPTALCWDVSADQLELWTQLTTRWTNYRPQDGS